MRPRGLAERPWLVVDSAWVPAFAGMSGVLGGLRPLEPALVDVVGGRRPAALGGLALEVEALPGLLQRLRVAGLELGVELVPRRRPDRVLVLELRLAVQRADHRLEHVELAMLDDIDEAERLALLEA